MYLRFLFFAFSMNSSTMLNRSSEYVPYLRMKNIQSFMLEYHTNFRFFVNGLYQVEEILFYIC